MTINLHIPVFQPARIEHDKGHIDRSLEDIYRTLIQLRDAVAGLPDISSGNGTPEGTVEADVGALFIRLDGGVNTVLYVKESGTGNAGWVAK